MKTQRSFLGLFGICMAAALALGGCTIYLGPDDDDDGRPDDPPADCDPVTGVCDGWVCFSDKDCAPGCYCADPVNDGRPGTCVESGYCLGPSDCGPGMTCEDGTCKPTNPGCQVNADCPTGSVCTDGKYCAPTGACKADNECPKGTYCDEPRNTCVPGTDPNRPLCNREVTCNLGAPKCPPNQVPLVGADGCWTSTCVAIAECEAPPRCEVLNTEAACNARSSECDVVSRGFNCKRPDGSACQVGDQNCSCEKYQFDYCEPDAP